MGKAFYLAIKELEYPRSVCSTAKRRWWLNRKEEITRYLWDCFEIFMIKNLRV